jgi:hypothetical protein
MLIEPAKLARAAALVDSVMRPLLCRLRPVLFRAAHGTIRLVVLAVNLVILVAALEQVFPATMRTIWVYVLGVVAALRGLPLPPV